MGYPKVPSTKKVRAAIEAVKATDFSEFSYEDVKQFYFHHFDEMVFPSVEIKASDFAKLPIYRARLAADVSDESNPQEFSFPPNPKLHCKNVGRANWLGKSVFYGSLDARSAIMEIKDLYKGQEYFVSKWWFDFENLGVEFIRVTPMFYGISNQTFSWDSFFSKNGFEKNLLRDLGKLGTKRMMFYIQEICKLFSEKGDSLYKFTAFIADNTIYSGLNKPNELFFPIFIYPSVATENSSLNYAIHPLFVMNFMKFDKVVHFKLNEFGPEFVKSSIGKIGFPKQEKWELGWFQLLEKESERKFYIDKVECQCGAILHQDFEDHIKTKDSELSLNESIVREMIFDLERERSSNEFTTQFMKGLNIPHKLGYQFYSNFGNKFYFLDENKTSHENIQFHGGKEFSYELKPIKE